jgi:hypothetical protein
VAHWAPGALFVAAILPSFFGMSWSQTMTSLAEHPSVSLSAFAIAAFLFGEIFDSTRDLGEWLLDMLYQKANCNFIKKVVKKVNWDFFAEAKGDQLNNLEEYYFVYYCFNINSFIVLVITSVVFMITGQFGVLPLVVKIFGAIFALVLLADGLFLRKEIADHTNNYAGEK